MRNLSDSITVQRPLHLFLAHPTEDNYIYGINVVLVKKGEERHFILTTSDDDGEEPIISGHEAATCIQVIVSFSDEIKGLTIENIHFYAYYSNAWKYISFTEWNPDKIIKAWPECDTGAALGTPIVRNIYVRDNPMKDDFSTHPFTYWWHAVSANNDLISDYGDEISEHYRKIRREVPFGDITHEALEVRSYVTLYARHKWVLAQRIKAATGGKKPIYKTPIIQGGGWKGWASIVVLFDHMQVDHRIYEPNRHNVSKSEFLHLREDLERMGIEVVSLSDTVWRVVLSTELDLLKGPSNLRSFTLFRRGEHIFELTACEEDENDIPW